MPALCIRNLHKKAQFNQSLGFEPNIFIYERGVRVRRRPRRPRGRGLSSGAVWFRCARRCARRCRSVRREQTRDTFDKPLRGLDRLARSLRRHVRTGAGEIIGNGFELVSAGKERPQAGINARIVSHQPRKFPLDA
jgi:hypothetical protein